MDLLKIYENNKKEEEKYESEKKNYELKREFRRLISSVVKGDKKFGTNDSELIEKLNIKKAKPGSEISSFYRINYSYIFELNKTNIQKIQKYIDESLNLKEGK